MVELFGNACRGFHEVAGLVDDFGVAAVPTRDLVQRAYVYRFVDGPLCRRIDSDIGLELWLAVRRR